MAAVADTERSFGPISWTAENLNPDQGHIAIPSSVQQELSECTAYLARNPLPIVSLTPGDFALTRTHRFAATVRRELDQGFGFVLLDRLPVDEWTHDGCVAAYWLLASCMARPVAQSHDGKLIYHVRNLGRPPGNGVRPDVTNAAQNFHTDNSYNHVPPHYVGLLCLSPAERGGLSAIVSFGWALQQMKQHHPQLLERLFQPFYFDRQREHADDDVMVTHHPLFEVADGQLIARLSYRQVVNGQKLAREPLDALGHEALEALEAILNTPGASRSFSFERGQVQIINNRALGHRRSAFEDDPGSGAKRHLVRLWLRDSGRRGYHG